MHSNCRLLPDHIVCTITQRNNIRRANTCNPVFKLLHEDMTSDIQKHMVRKCLDAHRDHRHNTYSLWKTMHCTTHGNTPKHSGSYLIPKSRIQHTHSQHLSTRTQASINNKNTHCNRMV